MPAVSTSAMRRLEGAGVVWALLGLWLGGCDFLGAWDRCRDLGRCEPRLIALSASAGALRPAFDSHITAYTLDLPAGVISTRLTPAVAEPDTVTVSIAGRVVPSGAASEALEVGPAGREVSVVLAEPSGALVTSYSVRLRRAPPSYLKASNTGAGDELGAAVALSADGTTLAVGAPGEASAATGVGGDQHDDGALGAGAVYLYVRSGTSWIQRAYLKASNAGAGDRFGAALALSADGTMLAVGAAGEDSAATGVGGDESSGAATDSGAVYVFVLSGEVWNQVAYLKASNTGAGDGFGGALALARDQTKDRWILAVGARGEDSSATGVGGDQRNDAALEAGAAYVFTRSGTSWAQTAYLKAPNTGAGDGFGGALAISGSGQVLAVGARGEDSGAVGVNGALADESAPDSGAAYLYSMGSSAWVLQAYIKATNTDPGDGLGASVALAKDGMTLAVGAELERSGVSGDSTDDGAPGAGAVYVYGRGESAWVAQAYLKAAEPTASAAFGSAVALTANGASLVVGASGARSGAGVVSLFTRTDDGQAWGAEVTLEASTAAGARWGAAVDVSGSGMVVVGGAPGDSSAATGAGGEAGLTAAPRSGAAYVH